MSKTSKLTIFELIAGSDLFLPALLLLVYALFLFFIRGILPSSGELLIFFSKFYAEYGYQILFAAALLESLVLINLFAPGQVALTMGIVFSRTGETQLPLVMLTVASGVLIGFAIDYFLGYYGFADFLHRFKQKKFIDKAKEQIQKNGTQAIFISFINTNLGSYISLAAGTSDFKPARFFSIAIFSILFWVCSWSLLIYIVGDIMIVLIRKYALLLSAVFLGILIVVMAWPSKEK